MNSYRDDSAEVAGQGNNLSKASESATAAVLGSSVIEALESGARNRAARVAGVKLVKKAVDAVVPGLLFSRGVLILRLGVLPRLLVLGLRLVLLGLLLGLLLVLRLRATVLGRGSSGQGSNSSNGELHFDGCWKVRE